VEEIQNPIETPPSVFEAKADPPTDRQTCYVIQVIQTVVKSNTRFYVDIQRQAWLH